jgi:hypothetical protein
MCPNSRVVYPVRNNAGLICARLTLKIIPTGFNARFGFESQRLEFLTGVTVLFQ